MMTDEPTNLIHLLKKYDVPVPRYTSYPTVPFWNFESFSLEKWKEAISETFTRENGEICLYIHLPFCEELCTYCACNKRITKNHGVERPYLDTVLAEWKMYLEIFPSAPIIREIHLGGGTPTFFSPAHLQKLINGITKNGKIGEGHEFSVEVHPNHTTFEHLRTLRHLGFNRISLGVQDFDPKVQYIINRIQTFEQTKEVIDNARKLGFESVNIDLIYGLPKQTAESIVFTIERVKQMMPDRIAYYSYAHVPWKSRGQRRYTDEDVPRADEKMAMYNLGNSLLTKLGFESIGMDHFAQPNDKLMQAYHEGTLHRNFMGYTTTSHKLVIGLGASAISDTWTAFAQNEKTVEDYQDKIGRGEWAIVNGHLLSGDDQLIRQHILNLMCRGKTVIRPGDFDPAFLKNMHEQLMGLESDKLAELKGETIMVRPEGKLFIRNICSVLDRYLLNNSPQKPLFSKAI